MLLVPDISGFICDFDKMIQGKWVIRVFLPKTNKKSAESDVAPAGIKSYKFLIVHKKNLFCSIQEIGGLVCKKNGRRKFGILACKI